MGERGREARVGDEEMRTPWFEAQKWRLHVLLRATTYRVKTGRERGEVSYRNCVWVHVDGTSPCFARLSRLSVLAFWAFDMG